MVLSPIGLAVGWIIYLITDKTPNFAYQSMIVLFCFTRGKSSDLISKVIALFRPSYTFSTYEGVLGKSTELELGHIDQRLREDGYFVFDNKLSEELCDALLTFATTQECLPQLIQNESGANTGPCIYQRGAPQTSRYNFNTQDLLQNKEIQNLMADSCFADVAQRYLGACPLVDVVAMWWSTDFSKTPDEEAAQFFHFDMDRPRWLKFFFCLTDVNSDSGPHVFVKGSHKTNGIPRSILKKGYSRLSEEEVINHYGQDKIVEFVAKRGTIIAEDSRGLHKGKHLQNGDRLMFQIQFSNSGFGSIYPPANFGDNLTEELRDSVKKYPKIFANYTKAS